MDNICSRCNGQIGKCDDGKWNNYMRILYYNSAMRGYELVYLCHQCEPFPVHWKCTRCRKVITDVNTEFCIQPENEQYSLKTCVSCLNVLRE